MKYLNDISYKDCVGKVCKSKSSGDFKIVEYNNKTDVKIQFINTGYEAVVELGNIRNGGVKDPYLPSVCGVGVSGNKYPITVNGVKTKECELWMDMLKRCYSDTYQKKYPTYEGCEVSDNFKNYEYFYEWCHNQIGFGIEGWHLDKDLLVKGNKIYSEPTCVFLPKEINLVFTKCTASRGEHPIGVNWNKTNKAFVARVRKNKGRSEWLGYFKTELEAFNAYKQAKEAHLKELAAKWKSQIDECAYLALINYEVHIDD